MIKGLSSPKIGRKSVIFPSLSVKDKKYIKSHKSQALLLSSPTIEKNKRNLLLMRQANPFNHSVSDSGSDTSVIIKRMESGKKVPLPQIVLLKKNSNSKNLIRSEYVKENLVGEQAIKKFYERYKNIDRAQEMQEFTKKRNPVTQIVTLLSQHNFTPRKLDLIKLKGSQAILDLRKLGLGQGSMGPLIAELVEYLASFDEVDFSYNCIDSLLSEILIPKLGKVKKINLSHNRIGKTGCQRLSELFTNRTNIIEQLILEENSLADHAAVPLIQQIPIFKKVKILKLSKNFLSLRSAQKLKQMLFDDEILTQLYLGWNQFTSKATKLIFQGIERNSSIRVLDFSWNPIDQYNAQILEKIFSRNDNLIHLDLSFCELNIKSTSRLSQALNDNHSLYGLHYEGNSGYINFKGYMLQTQKEHFQYPLPIIRGVTREINGVKSNPISNEFKSNLHLDVCWICSCWQQMYIKIDKQLYPTAKQCYMHLQHEKYTGIKMQEAKYQFQLYRMCPLDCKLVFFFTIVTPDNTRQYITSNIFPTINNIVKIAIVLGQNELQAVVQKRNILNIAYECQPIDTDYNPNIRCQPRTTELAVQNDKIIDPIILQVQKKKIYKNRAVYREQKVQRQFKQIPEDNQFLNDDMDKDQDYDYIRKCIHFDIQNSKIIKILKDSQVIENFINMMVKYYKHFKDCFYFLSKTNPNSFGIYTIPEIEIDKFVQDQRYISKRMTHAKIRLKLYSCLSIGEANSKNTEVRLISRPQFLEFLIRIAMEKWCTQVPTKKDPQENNGQEQEIIKKKLKLPLPLLDGIEKVMSGLEKYAVQVRDSNWRKQKYLKIQIYIIIKGYQDFLHSLFEKYSLGKNKLAKSKKLQGLITIEDFRRIFIETHLKRTKQSMKEADQMFLSAKRFEIEDGKCEYGLNYDEFLECLARYSECLWFDPIATAKQPFWQSQMNRINTPLFLCFEALIVNIYWLQMDLHSKRLSRICKYGLFQQQSAIIMQKIKLKDSRSKTSFFMKMNTLEEQPNEITLKSIIEELKEKQGFTVIKHQDIIVEEHQIDY